MTKKELAKLMDEGCGLSGPAMDHFCDAVRRGNDDEAREVLAKHGERDLTKADLQQVVEEVRRRDPAGPNARHPLMVDWLWLYDHADRKTTEALHSGAMRDMDPTDRIKALGGPEPAAYVVSGWGKSGHYAWRLEEMKAWLATRK